MSAKTVSFADACPVTLAGATCAVREPTSAAALVASALPLERQWRFWLHLPCYDNCYERTRNALHHAAIGSVQQFWHYMNALPPPSTHFYAAGKRHMVDGRAIEGWSMFEYEARPDWEHARNTGGCTLTCKAAFSRAEIDLVWRDLLLALVGETAPHSEHVVGVRVLDRTHAYRIELWLDARTSTAITDALRQWLFSAPHGPLRARRAAEVVCFVNAHTADVGKPSGARNKK